MAQNDSHTSVGAGAQCKWILSSLLCK